MPLKSPYLFRAVIAKDEHEGSKRQQENRKGEIRI